MSYTLEEVKDLELFFNSVNCPKSIDLYQGTRITDSSKFLESHFTTLYNNIGNSLYSPCFTRLVSLRKLLEAQG